MPCDDIRERIEIRLDNDDHLVDYSLLKNTCGAPVGHEALLLSRLKGESVFDLIQSDENTWFDPELDSSEDDVFLYYKHLFALRAAIQAAYGFTTGGPDDLCALACMGYDIHGARIEGLIAIEALTQEIKSCGNCKSCRT